MKEKLRTILAQTTFAQLSHPTKKETLQKVHIRRIQTEPLLFYIEEFTKTQSFHKNLSCDECFQYLTEKIGQQFKNSLFETPDRHYRFLSNKRGLTRILEQPIQPSQKQANNKTKDEVNVSTTTANYRGQDKIKNHLLPEGTPVAFLIELGIMNNEGRVFDKKQKKFRQINRFLEFIADILDDLCAEKQPTESNPLSIIDFGSGKSYLTFALYHFIVVEKKIPSRIVGLDLRSDLIQSCTALAEKCAYTNLSFINDSIESHLQKEATTCELDIMISLHVCNTATDYAIAAAVQKKARTILSVPCCQHELHKKLQENPLSPDNPYAPFTRYGLIREQFSALTTDLMRALLLEKAGYKVQVLEFIDSEHTPKNMLIRAVRRQSPKTTQSTEATQNDQANSNTDLKTLQRELGIELELEKLFKEKRKDHRGS